MRFFVKITSHPLPNHNHLRIVCNSSHLDRFAHSSPTVLWQPRFTRRLSVSLAFGLEELHPEQRLPDKLAQDVARWRHDCPRVRVTEQAFDTQMLLRTPHPRKG